MASLSDRLKFSQTSIRGLAESHNKARFLHLECLNKRGQWKLKLIFSSVKSNISQTLRSTKPPAKLLIAKNLQLLNKGDWELIHSEGPPNPRQDTKLIHPGLVCARKVSLVDTFDAVCHIVH